MKLYRITYDTKEGERTSFVFKVRENFVPFYFNEGEFLEIKPKLIEEIEINFQGKIVLKNDIQENKVFSRY